MICSSEISCGGSVRSYGLLTFRSIKLGERIPGWYTTVRRPREKDISKLVMGKYLPHI